MDQINRNQQTGKDSFFSAFKPAWHKKGTIVNDYVTSAEAMRHAQLTFTVEKRPGFTFNGKAFKAWQGMSTKEQELFIAHPELFPNLMIPDCFATVRADTDEVLGKVGAEYTVVPNEVAFGFFDNIVGGDGIMFETAGALGKGERIFITAKLPGYIKVKGRDNVGKYLFCANYHDGTGSLIVGFTPIRIECANTLAASLSTCRHFIKLRHTTNVKDKLAQAAEVLEMSNTLTASMNEIFNSWANKPVRDEEAKKIILQSLIPNKEQRKKILSGENVELSKQLQNTCEKVFEFTAGHQTQQDDATRGTLYGVYNGITGYYQHVAKFKNDDAKIKSIFMGGPVSMKTQSAFDLCMDFYAKGSNSLN